MALNINGTTGISGVDGSASAPAVTGTDSNTGINFGSDTVNINTGGTTRATVDSSGFLGVGTTSPSSFNADGRNLVVGTGSGGQGLSIYSANNNYGNIYFADGTSDGSYNAGGILYNHSSNFMRFDTAAAERIRIDSAGRLFINATTTSTVLSGAEAKYFDTGDGCRLMSSRASTAAREHIIFINPNGEIGSIKTSSSSTSFNTSSDYRLKENVVGISDGITRLKTLKPSRFNFKVDKDTTVDGFLAHEVTAVPEAISGTKDETQDILYTEEDTIPSGKKVGDVKETVPKYQGIDQSKLVPLLTAALQEAVAKIEVLETKVAALEAG